MRILVFNTTTVTFWHKTLSAPLRNEKNKTIYQFL